MKFIKGHLASIDGVSIYPIITLLIFFTFFVTLIWWVMGFEKKKMNEISNIPLNEDENKNTL